MGPDLGLTVEPAGRNPRAPTWADRLIEAAGLGLVLLGIGGAGWSWGLVGAVLILVSYIRYRQRWKGTDRGPVKDPRGAGQGPDGDSDADGGD